MHVTRRQLIGGLATSGMAFALAALGGCATASAPGAQASQVRATVFCFDTVCELGGSMPQSVLDEACSMCERFEQLFSRTIASSDVGRINSAAGAVVDVDLETASLVSQALSYCEASDGLFDITIGAVSELWDFTEGVVPTDDAIAAALPHVGWQRVEVGDNTVRLADPHARIDLGGIAKGYIADRLLDHFAKKGVTCAFVNLGGNVAVMGTKPDGSPWSIGVRNPEDEGGSSVIAKISSEGGSLVTSGLYERSFERDGRRYWHILDPRTGYPVQSDLVSASVYSKRSIDGDGLTKPLFMLDEDDALRFIEQRDGLQALLVDAKGNMRMTKGATFET